MLGHWYTLLLARVGEPTVPPPVVPVAPVDAGGGGGGRARRWAAEQADSARRIHNHNLAIIGLVSMLVTTGVLDD